MRAADIIEALQRKHAPAKGWVTVAEVCVDTGGFAQRLDLFAMATWRTLDYERIAYEVKVTRADFMREVVDPTKRAAAVARSHFFRFATPAGLVQANEVPHGCGLVWVMPSGKTRRVVRGDRNPEPVTPDGWVASLLRTAAEQRSMGVRCGVNGCHRHGPYHVWVGRDLLAFCSSHIEVARRLGGRLAEPRSGYAAGVMP